MQPVGNVYVMVDVPGAMPDTIPEVPIVATVVILLLHVPPPASARDVVVPAHKMVTPVIADGSGLTVTIDVTLHPDETR
jgi:hypothetical protein